MKTAPTTKPLLAPIRRELPPQPAADPAAPSSLRTSCPICSSDTKHVISLRGDVTSGVYHLRECVHCRFLYIANPCLDYASLYDEAYYRGEGADPLVDYEYELAEPEKTIRVHEWHGVAKLVGSLVPLTAETRWLDFGCGAGGLVRYANAHLPGKTVGYDVGWSTERAREAGIDVIDDAALSKATESFDVVTAVEVLEHIPDPIPTLKRIRRLLKPGGLFFYTTGNAAPHHETISGWRYIRPEIHTSYFNPLAMTLALRAAGFDVEPGRFLPGCEEIVRFKVLKNLRVRKRSWLHNLLPWGPIARRLNKRLGLFDHPIGWAAGPRKSF